MRGAGHLHSGPDGHRPPADAFDAQSVQRLREELISTVEGLADQLRSVPMQMADNLKALVDALSELIAQHIKLARVELKEDVKGLATQVGKIAAFVPLLIFGYLFLTVAAALFLSRYVPVDAAFLIVAGSHFALGGLGIALAVRKLKAAKVLSKTKNELQSTATALTLRSTR